jgi:hypothetical protein
MSKIKYQTIGYNPGFLLMVNEKGKPCSAGQLFDLLEGIFAHIQQSTDEVNASISDMLECSNKKPWSKSKIAKYTNGLCDTGFLLEDNLVQHGMFHFLLEQHYYYRTNRPFPPVDLRRRKKNGCT